MNSTQFTSLFRQLLERYKMTYFDPCTGNCVQGQCNTGNGGTDVFVTSVTFNNLINSWVITQSDNTTFNITWTDILTSPLFCQAVKDCETLTTISVNNGIITYINEDSTVVNIDVKAIVCDVFSNIPDYDQVNDSIDGFIGLTTNPCPNKLVKLTHCQLAKELLGTIEWFKEELPPISTNVLPNLTFNPIPGSSFLCFDQAMLEEGGLNPEYTISGTTITVYPGAIGKDIVPGNRVWIKYQGFANACLNEGIDV